MLCVLCGFNSGGRSQRNQTKPRRTRRFAEGKDLRFVLMLGRPGAKKSWQTVPLYMVEGNRNGRNGSLSLTLFEVALLPDHHGACPRGVVFGRPEKPREHASSPGRACPGRVMFGQ